MVNQIQFRKCLFFINIIFFLHWKLEIAVAISASNSETRVKKLNLFYKKLVFFCHLKLEIVLSISASNKQKLVTNN